MAKTMAEGGIMAKTWKKSLDTCDRCGRRLEVWIESALVVDFVEDGDHVRCSTCKREGEVVGQDVEWEGSACKGGCAL